MLTNEEIMLPLSDERKYELVQLENDFEVLWISDSNAQRSGFSWSVDTTPFTMNVGQGGGIEEISQNVIVSKTPEGKEFNKKIREVFGNFKFSREEKMHFFYFDVATEDLESTIVSFFNMLYKNNLFDHAEDASEFDWEWEQLKSEYEKNVKINIKKDNKDAFADMVDSILFGDKEMTEKQSTQTWSNLSALKQLYDLCYLNPKYLKMVVISELDANTMKKAVLPIWKNLKKSGNKTNSKEGNKDKQDTNFSNWLGNAYLYLSVTSANTIDMIIPCLQTNHIGVSVYEYINYLIQDTGDNSLKRVLEQNNLSTKWSSQLVNKDNRRNYFHISLAVTEKGLESVELVISIIQTYFRELINNEHLEQSYNDLKQIYQTKFDFLTIANYQWYLKTINSNLSKLPQKELKSLLYSDYALEDFNLVTIQDTIQSLLNTSRYSIFISYNSESTFLKETTDSKYATFNYNNRAYQLLSLSTMNFDTNTEYNFEFKQANMYITSLKNITRISNENAQKYIHNYRPCLHEWNEVVPENELWYSNDPSYKIPRVETYLAFNYANEQVFKTKSNWTYLESKLDTMELLFFNRVKRLIKNKLISAEESGNTIDLKFSREKGFTVHISSYSDKVVLIIEEILSVVFNEQNFENWSYSDFDKITYNNINDKFFDYLFYYASDILRFKFEAKSFLKKTSFGYDLLIPWTVNDEFKNALVDYQRSFFKKEVKVKALVYGIIEPEEEIRNQIGEVIKKYNTKQSALEQLENTNYYHNPNTYKNQCLILQYHEAFWKVESETEFMIDSLFMGNRTGINDAMSDLIVQTFKGIFKHKYSFNSDNVIHVIEKVYWQNHIYLKIVKKSREDPPNTLYNETNNEWTELMGKIENISDDNFEMMKKFLLGVKERDPLTLRLKAEKVWYELSEDTRNFDWHNDYIQDLTTLQKNDFISYAKDVLMNNLWISFHFYPDKSKMTGRATGVYNTLRKINCEVRSKETVYDYFGW